MSLGHTARDVVTRAFLLGSLSRRESKDGVLSPSGWRARWSVSKNISTVNRESISFTSAWCPLTRTNTTFLDSGENDSNFKNVPIETHIFRMCSTLIHIHAEKHACTKQTHVILRISTSKKTTHNSTTISSQPQIYQPSSSLSNQLAWQSSLCPWDFSAETSLQDV